MSKSKKELDEVEKALTGLDLRERCVVLIMSIVQIDKSALGAIYGLINTINWMTAEMSMSQRYRVSEVLRNCADRVESGLLEKVQAVN